MIAAKVEAPAHSSTRLIWVLLVASVFLVALPGWMLLASGGIESRSASLPALGVVAMAGARLVWITVHGPRHIYEAVLWIFIYAFLGCAPLVQLRLGLEVDTARAVDSWYESAAWCVIAIGCVAVVTGSWLASKRPVTAVHMPFPSTLPTYLLTTAAAIASIYLVAKVGFSTLFTDRLLIDEAAEQHFNDDAARSTLSGFSQIGLLVGTIALMQLLHRSRPGDRTRRCHQFALALSLALLLLTINPFTSARFLYGTVMLSLAAGFGLYRTQVGYRLTVVGGCVAMFVIFPAFSFFREVGKASGFNGVVEAFRTGDFDAFSQLVNVVDYVAQHGLQQGRQLLGASLFWVPRTLWPGKPIDTGTLVAEYKGYGFTNLSSPIFSELYIDGGYLAVFVGSAALGFFLRNADIRATAQLRRYPTPSLLNSLLPFGALIAYRGSLLHATSILALTWLCATFVTLRWPGARTVNWIRVTTRESYLHLEQELTMDSNSTLGRRLRNFVSSAIVPLTIFSIIGLLIGGVFALQFKEQFTASTVFSIRPITPRGAAFSMDPAMLEARVNSYKNLASTDEFTKEIQAINANVPSSPSSLRVSVLAGTSDIALEVVHPTSAGAERLVQSWYKALRTKILDIERESAKFTTNTVAILPISHGNASSTSLSRKFLAVVGGLFIGVSVGALFSLALKRVR